MENGKKERRVAKEYSSTKMVQCTMESGSMTSIMVKERSNGNTIKSSIQEISLIVKRLARVNLSSMEMFTRAISSKDNFTEKESISLQMQAKPMKENLIQIIFRDQVR